ncbi:MAG: hypothetical protein JSR17_12945 [Proteobacteria bacterium]|nr:hypothetical protein [Pseudomonadota bacterium]
MSLSGTLQQIDFHNTNSLLEAIGEQLKRQAIFEKLKTLDFQNDDDFQIIKSIHYAALNETVEKGTNTYATAFKIIFSQYKTALEASDVDQRKKLFSRFVNLLSTNPHDKSLTPLCLALYHNDMQVFDVLCSNGADPKYITDEGLNLLHMAGLTLANHQENWYPKLFALGLDSPEHIDSNWLDDGKDTLTYPLKLALMRPEIALELLEKGASTTILDVSDKEVLGRHLVKLIKDKENDKAKEMLAYPIAYRISPALNKDVTLLDYAIHIKNHEMATHLIKLGANLFHEDEHGKVTYFRIQQNIIDAKLNDDFSEAEKWQNLIENVVLPPKMNLHDFSQVNIIARINWYVKNYNQRNPNNPIKLPFDSPEGWCHGLTTIWGYLKMHQDPKFNEVWFFNKLYEISTLPYDALASEDHLVFDKLIGYANWLQSDAKPGDKYDPGFGFALGQATFPEHMDIQVVDQVQMVFHSKTEIELLLDEYAKKNPGKFIRLSAAGHVIGFMYDKAHDKFITYDANNASGDRTGKVTHGKVVKFPERALSKDEFIRKLEFAFSRFNYQACALSLKIHDKKKGVILEEGHKEKMQQKREAFFDRILAQRENANVDAKSADGKTNISFALMVGDIASAIYFIRKGETLEVQDWLEIIMKEEHFNLILEEVKKQIVKKHPDNAHEIFQQIISAKYDIAKISQPLLNVAVFGKKNAIVIRLLAEGCDIDAVYENSAGAKMTALHSAFSVKGYETAEILLQAKANPNHPMQTQEGPVYPTSWLILLKDAKGLELLLKYKANLSTSGVDLLIEHLINKEPEVNELIKVICHQNQNEFLLKNPRLLYAAIHANNVEAVKLILEALESSPKDKIAHLNHIIHQKTAFEYALENQNKKMLKLLLEHGAPCNDQELARAHKIMHSRKSLIKSVKPRDVSKQDFSMRVFTRHFKDNALVKSILTGDTHEFNKLVNKTNAIQFHKVAPFGEINLLYIAAKCNRPQMAAKLYSLGAEVDNALKDKVGQQSMSALVAAAKEGHPEVIEAILTQSKQHYTTGFTRTKQDDEGKTVLHYLAQRGLTDSFIRFLQTEQDKTKLSAYDFPALCNIYDKQGNSPLHYLAMTATVEDIKRIDDYARKLTNYRGAKVCPQGITSLFKDNRLSALATKNQDGDLPIDLARKHGRPEVTDFLYTLMEESKELTPEIKRPMPAIESPTTTYKKG